MTARIVKAASAMSEEIEMRTRAAVALKICPTLIVMLRGRGAWLRRERLVLRTCATVQEIPYSEVHRWPARGTKLCSSDLHTVNCRMKMEAAARARPSRPGWGGTTKSFSEISPAY